jgi:hypothetical protein
MGTIPADTTAILAATLAFNTIRAFLLFSHILNFMNPF